MTVWLFDLIDPDDFASPASDEAIRAVEQTLRVRFPADYVEFVRSHNGGEGAIGDEGYVRLSAVEDLVSLRAELSGLDHLAGVLVIGCLDGEAYAFDAEGHVLIVPLIGGMEDAIPQGSFHDFMRRCAAGTCFDRRSDRS